jgi:DNA replication protein DnaC
MLASCIGNDSDGCRKCQKDRRAWRKDVFKKMWSGEPYPEYPPQWQKAKPIPIAPTKRFYGATWETLTRSEQQQIMPFVEGDMELLTFVGPAGAGKTWAAWATTFAVVIDHPVARFITWFELDQWAKDSRLFDDRGGDARWYLDRLKDCDLLVIDEFATAKPWDAEFMTVMGVIHHRYDRRLRTILITTKSDAELMASVGEAMVSRINSGIMVRMQGRDKRLHT